MSLLNEMKTTCVILDKRTVPDGLGGYLIEYVEGARFQAAVIKDSTLNARVAEKQGVKEIYTVVVDKGVPLEFHDIFRRESDGLTFRVTSNVTDSEAPDRSTVKIGKVSAERFDISG